METVIWRPLIALIVVLTALAGIAVSMGRTLPGGALLTYEANFETDIELYGYDVEHGRTVNLTRNPASYDTDGAWSPDGEKLAFLSWRDGYRQLYLLTLSPPRITRLGEFEVVGRHPVWSPDGTRLIYEARRRVRGPVDLYLVDLTAPLVEGVNPQALGDDIPGGVFPAWSPDGVEIAFTSEMNGNAEIYTARIDGTGAGNRTQNPGWDVVPAWSPDGRRIAFYSVRDTGSLNLYTMARDGSNVERVGSAETVIRTTLSWTPPLWSEDGAIIASVANLDGKAAIFTWSADGAQTWHAAIDERIFGLDMWLRDTLLLTEVYKLATFRIVQITPDGQQRVLIENGSYPVLWR